MKSIGLSIAIISFITVLLAMQAGKKQTNTMYPELIKNCETIAAEFDQIPAERKEELAQVTAYIQQRLADSGTCQLVYICTHNSRRSHFGQLWGQAAAHYYGIQGVVTYSGGTEATAFNPRAVAAAQRAGFKIEQQSEGKNPTYRVNLGEGMETLTLFSKRYDDAANPQKGFGAILVCSDADEACPIVRGAEKRFAIPYDDPKAFDNTPQETQKYDERCRQIAREVLYVFSQVKK